MIVDLKNRTVDIENELQEADDEMGPEVTLKGLIKIYFLNEIKRTLSVGMKDNRMHSSLSLMGMYAVDSYSLWDMIKESLCGGIVSDLIPYVDEVIRGAEVIR